MACDSGGKWLRRTLWTCGLAVVLYLLSPGLLLFLLGADVISGDAAVSISAVYAPQRLALKSFPPLKRLSMAYEEWAYELGYDATHSDAE